MATKMAAIVTEKDQIASLVIPTPRTVASSPFAFRKMYANPPGSTAVVTLVSKDDFAQS